MAFSQPVHHLTSARDDRRSGRTRRNSEGRGIHTHYRDLYGKPNREQKQTIEEQAKAIEEKDRQMAELKRPAKQVLNRRASAECDHLKYALLRRTPVSLV
jgi:hypothetical protein